MKVFMVVPAILVAETVVAVVRLNSQDRTHTRKDPQLAYLLRAIERITTSSNNNLQRQPYQDKAVVMLEQPMEELGQAQDMLTMVEIHRQMPSGTISLVRPLVREHLEK